MELAKLHAEAVEYQDKSRELNKTNKKIDKALKEYFGELDAFEKRPSASEEKAGMNKLLRDTELRRTQPPYGTRIQPRYSFVDSSLANRIATGDNVSENELIEFETQQKNDFLTKQASSGANGVKTEGPDTINTKTFKPSERNDYLNEVKNVVTEEIYEPVYPVRDAKAEAKL